MELNFRQRYGVDILGVKNGEKMNISPAADYVFKQGEHLMVLSNKPCIDKILKNI